MLSWAFASPFQSCRSKGSIRKKTLCCLDCRCVRIFMSKRGVPLENKDTSTWTKIMHDVWYIHHAWSWSMWQLPLSILESIFSPVCIMVIMLRMRMRMAHPVFLSIVVRYGRYSNYIVPIDGGTAITTTNHSAATMGTRKDMRSIDRSISASAVSMSSSPRFCAPYCDCDNVFWTGTLLLS